MSARKSTAAKTAKRRSVSQHFDLSQIESLQLGFTDQQGNEVLVIELDRGTANMPQLNISTSFSATGDLKSCLTIYDLDA